MTTPSNTLSPCNPAINPASIPPPSPHVNSPHSSKACVKVKTLHTSCLLPFRDAAVLSLRFVCAALPSATKLPLQLCGWRPKDTSSSGAQVFIRTLLIDPVLHSYVFLYSYYGTAFCNTTLKILFG